jgi:enoyl-CoA hydratase
LYEFVQVTVEGRIASVQICRPPVNALNRELVAELTRVAKQLRGCNETVVVKLTAAGRVFCAGADLKERKSVLESQVARVSKNIQRMCLAWVEVPQPVLAGVHGDALGGGLELALTADIIAASETASLGFPEVSLGIIPAAGGTQRLSQRTSLGVANKWVLSAARYGAAEALKDGVVDFVYPAESFESEFEHLVSRLAAGAPLALRQAKRALNATYCEGLRRGLRRESECYAALIPTRDRREALEAFAERRAPVWRGE